MSILFIKGCCTFSNIKNGRKKKWFATRENLIHKKDNRTLCIVLLGLQKAMSFDLNFAGLLYGYRGPRCLEVHVYKCTLVAPLCNLNSLRLQPILKQQKTFDSFQKEDYKNVCINERDRTVLQFQMKKAPFKVRRTQPINIGTNFFNYPYPLATMASR